MMKRLLSLSLLLVAAAGCLSAPPRRPDSWLVEWRAPEGFKLLKLERQGPLRLGQVEVRSPYEVTDFAVLRADGSIAFDHYNNFAARPSALLRSAVTDALEQSGVCTRAVGPGSMARSDEILEVSVGQLALDCRGQLRQATVSLTLTLLSEREVVTVQHATASVPAADNYTEAFSRAFSTAFVDALVRAVNR